MKISPTFLLIILSLAMFLLPIGAQQVDPKLERMQTTSSLVGYYLADEAYYQGIFTYDWSTIKPNSGVFLYDSEGINFDVQIAYYVRKLVLFVTIYDDNPSSIVTATNTTNGEQLSLIFSQNTPGFTDDYCVKINLGKNTSYVSAGSYTNGSFQYQQTTSIVPAIKYENSAWHAQVRIDIAQPDVSIPYDQSLPFGISYTNYQNNISLGTDNGFDGLILNNYLSTEDSTLLTSVEFLDPQPTFYSERKGLSIVALYPGYYGQVLLKLRINLIVPIYAVEFKEISPIYIQAITGLDGSSQSIIKSANKATVRIGTLSKTADMTLEYWIDVPEDQAAGDVIWPSVNVTYTDVYNNPHFVSVLPPQTVHVYESKAAAENIQGNTTSQETIDFNDQGLSSFDTFVFEVEIIIGAFLIILGILSFAVSKNFSKKIAQFQEASENLIVALAKQSKHPHPETVESFMRRTLLDISTLTAELQLLDKKRSVTSSDIVFAQGKFKQILAERVRMYFNELPTYQDMLRSIQKFK